MLLQHHQKKTKTFVLLILTTPIQRFKPTQNFRYLSNFKINANVKYWYI